jgi:hypothetical protein
MIGDVLSTDVRPGDMVKLVKQEYASIWEVNIDYAMGRNQVIQARRGEWGLVLNMDPNLNGFYILFKGKMGWVTKYNWLRVIL